MRRYLLWWLEDREGLYGRTEPFQLDDVNVKGGSGEDL